MHADAFREIASAFCRENDLCLTISGDMPAGYETAFGTYDVTIHTLFLNFPLLDRVSECESLYYLYHELRHAMQYLHPSAFDAHIQKSRFYVILYNGICYRLTENSWQECRLTGSQEDFTAAYLSLPYELDANAFAYERVRETCGDSPELLALYHSWLPEKILPYPELQKIFARIDDTLPQI